MNDMTPAGIGHNGSPDPIEKVLAQYADTLSEAQNWGDGEPVTDEAGMKAVDAVLKEFKSYKSALAAAGKERTDPLHKAWKAEVAAVKVYTDDADLIQQALVDIVAPFKQKLAAEKAEADRLAWEETNRLRREAEAQAAKARAGDIDAQREAQAAKQAVIDAEKAAKATAKDAPKGMRTVKEAVVIDVVKLARYLWEHDREEQLAFQAVRAQKMGLNIAGVVEIRSEKRAF